MPESSILHKNLSFCPDLTGAKARKANLSTGNADAVTAQVNTVNIKTMVTQIKTRDLNSNNDASVNKLPDVMGKRK